MECDVAWDFAGRVRVSALISAKSALPVTGAGQHADFNGVLEIEATTAFIANRICRRLGDRMKQS